MTALGVGQLIREILGGSILVRESFGEGGTARVAVSRLGGV